MRIRGAVDRSQLTDAGQERQDRNGRGRILIESPGLRVKRRVETVREPDEDPVASRAGRFGLGNRRLIERFGLCAKLDASVRVLRGRSARRQRRSVRRAPARATRQSGEPMRQRRRRRQLEDLRQPILRIQLEHLHVQLVERVLLRVPVAIRPAPVTSGWPRSGPGTPTKNSGIPRP